MKKIMFFVASSVLILSVIACGSATPVQVSTYPPIQPTDTLYLVNVQSSSIIPSREDIISVLERGSFTRYSEGESYCTTPCTVYMNHAAGEFLASIYDNGQLVLALQVEGSDVNTNGQGMMLLDILQLYPDAVRSYVHDCITNYTAALASGNTLSQTVSGNGLQYTVQVSADPNTNSIIITINQVGS